jgi:hypothetical protein
VTDADVVFEASTPFGTTVRVTRERWDIVVSVKHPTMAGREDAVRHVLESPDEVRQSRSHPEVLLFYKAETNKRWTCAVVRTTNDQAFLVTAYPTDAIKEGVRIWPK